MRVSRMIAGRVLLIVVFCLTICAFTHMQVANAESAGVHNSVTRAFKIQGNLIVLDLESGFPWTVLDQGWCSEIGQFVAVSKWSSTTEAFGILYAPNGDQLFWKISDGPVVFTGGTGRFQNVSGGFITTEIVDLPPVEGPDGTHTYPTTYKGEGTITY
jgi:hypothetical protein